MIQEGNISVSMSRLVAVSEHSEVTHSIGTAPLEVGMRTLFRVIVWSMECPLFPHPQGQYARHRTTLRYKCTAVAPISPECPRRQDTAV